MSGIKTNFGILGLFLLITTLVAAGNSTEKNSRNLADLSIEELMDETVTSVSKKEQRLQDAPSAISVLTNDDLRRSGFTTVAEALRLVPGMSVGSVNSSQWAISARGFNSLYANKLLVLVDGRAVYSPLFSGVYWDLQQTMLDDVDRIEVIRGPGATIWGANAVNGVINVVTRSAKDTQGGLVYGGGGDVHRAIGGARYGGQINQNTYYRIFGGYQLHDDYPLANGQSANDGWQGGQSGFRVDHYPQLDTQLTWQSDVTVSDLDDHASEAYNVNTLARWSRQISEQSSLEAQVYYDRTYRDELSRARVAYDVVDFTLQNNLGISERNNLIWGLGYRFINNKIEQTNPLIQVRDEDSEQQLFSTFVQNEFQLLPDQLILTVGTKLEHNDFTGFEVQPSVRILYKPVESQTVWAAVSRAVRTPSEVEERDVIAIAVAPPVLGPGGDLYVPTIVGNNNLKPEVLWAYELGYRIRPAERISVDLAVFYNDYSDLISYGGVGQFVAGLPVGTAEMPFGNYLTGETYGGELSVTVSPTDAWRLTGSYSLLLAQIDGYGGADPGPTERGSPCHQALLRSSFDVTSQISADAQLRYVDNIEFVSSYITADLRISYRPTDQLEFALVGQNLLDDQHPEQGPAFFATVAEVPRGVYGKITWRF